MTTIKLSNGKKGDCFTIVSFNDVSSVNNWPTMLYRLGILPGDEIKIIGKTFFGTIQVLHRKANVIGIGKSMAHQILVS